MYSPTGFAATIAALALALTASCTAHAPDHSPDAGPSSYQVAACELLCQCVSSVGCNTACYQDTEKCGASQLSAYLKCLQGKDACMTQPCDAGTCPKTSTCVITDYCHADAGP